MSIIDRKYSVTPGAHGLFQIEVTGRCTADERAAIEAGCTRRFELIPLPQMAGAVLKSLDGTNPIIVEVTPSTLTGSKYNCVKIEGVCNPFAYRQADGPYVGKTILRYLIRYQQVGGVS